jgi:hypothetical protein
MISPKTRNRKEQAMKEHILWHRPIGGNNKRNNTFEALAERLRITEENLGFLVRRLDSSTPAEQEMLKALRDTTVSRLGEAIGAIDEMIELGYTSGEQQEKEPT